MVRILCRAIDCIFNEAGRCTSDEITYDPEEGCMTYELIDDVLDLEEEDWEAGEEEESDEDTDDADDDEDFEYDDYDDDFGDEEGDDLDLYADDEDEGEEW
jgi:hypothetical protein